MSFPSKFFRKIKSKINLYRANRQLRRMSPADRRAFVEMATREKK